jgi:hypothetical protein
MAAQTLSCMPNPLHDRRRDPVQVQADAQAPDHICQQREILLLKDLTTDLRPSGVKVGTWAATTLKKLERVKAFFRFATARDSTDHNLRSP